MLGGCTHRPVTADSSLLRAAGGLPLCLLISPEAFCIFIMEVHPSGSGTRSLPEL